MNIFFRKVHRVYTLLILMLVFYAFYPFFFYFSRNELHYKTLNKLRTAFCKISSYLSGIFYKVEFEEKIDWSKNYIICSNHTSNLDIVALTIIVKNNYFFIGKHELLDQTITKLFFKTIDVPVNRSNKLSAYRSFKMATERVLNGYSAIIFPEGKIGEEYPPKLHDFKDGPFKMAVETNKSILPISIINNYKLFWDDGKKFGSKPGICKIYIHKPIETCNLTALKIEDLKNQTYNLVQSKLDYKL